MNSHNFYNELVRQGLTMFCGVPDSCLKELCACITEHAPRERHIIAANEGNALALAAGHYMATGSPAVVYMQNSGLGNIVNPLLSLLDEEVYRIPALLIIGWRGEPGVHDEPQHVKQGKLTLPLLDTMGVASDILTSESQIATACEYMQRTGKPCALVVRKGTFEPYAGSKTPSAYQMSREAAIRCVLEHLDARDIVVSSTGMISREVYENRSSHEKDFLTVGGMGHASSIALGIALNKPGRRVFCLDGDGAFLMHMGAAPVIASLRLSGFKHVIFNNEAHDSVGAQPTVMSGVDLPQLLKGCGYGKVYLATSPQEIEEVWADFYNADVPALLEIRVSTGSRKDLGRPRERPEENKRDFMSFIQSDHV